MEELHAAAEGAKRNKWAALGLAIGAVGLCVLGFVNHWGPRWYPPLALPVAVVAYRRYMRERDGQYRLWRLRRYYERGVERVEGRWAGQGESGEEFRKDQHAYSSDLNLFGRGSLFERLCTARTEIGRERLAAYLQEPVSMKEARARQEAVAELKECTALREEVAVLGRNDFTESHWQTFREWLDSPPVAFPDWARGPMMLTAAVLAVLAVGTFAGAVVPRRALRAAAPILFVHGVVGLLLRERANDVIAAVRRVSVEVGLVREGLELLARQPFRSAKLRGLMPDAAAGSTVRKLERVLRVMEERNKDWFYLPSLLLMTGTQCSIAVELWRLRHEDEFRRWLEAWAEFEALNALACYAAECGEDPFPELVDDGVVYDAAGLAHPLLVRRLAVRNDVRFDAQTRFWLVSGSNMAGKSTLLRSIGVNAVLAYAGAPVTAVRMRISRFALCASISVGDSLVDGKSRFLGEVERLRQAVTLAEEQAPALFLIDEIFSGTNSEDRRVAAEAVVRKLVGHGAVGAMTTHDLTLTGIAEIAGLGGANVHMGCREGAADPLDFDYRVKAGVTQERNALAIARMAGVLD